MSIGYPPKYRYALYEKWDKETFAFIKKMAKEKKYSKILGTYKDKNQFLTMLIRSQKSLHCWREFLKDVIDQVKEKDTIDTKIINKKYPPESVCKDKPAWVTYEEDALVSDFIDELETRKVEFIGTNDEIAEFVFRFTLGQLGHDWEQTIMMIWELLGNKNKINLKALNWEMRNFDYLKIFDMLVA